MSQWIPHCGGHILSCQRVRAREYRLTSGPNPRDLECEYTFDVFLSEPWGVSTWRPRCDEVFSA